MYEELLMALITPNLKSISSPENDFKFIELIAYNHFFLKEYKLALNYFKLLQMRSNEISYSLKVLECYIELKRYQEAKKLFAWLSKYLTTEAKKEFSLKLN